MVSKEELIQALQGLTPEQLSGILSQGHGRSPVSRGPLTDLRRPPTATDPRPVWVQDTDGREFEPITHAPYPALRWHLESGREITVQTAADDRALGKGWTSVPPASGPVDPAEHARQMFESLSPEDQAFVLEQQRQNRLAKVNVLMGTLTESQAAQAMAGVPKKGKSA